jgi:hypothetical protein
MRAGRDGLALLAWSIDALTGQELLDCLAGDDSLMADLRGG